MGVSGHYYTLINSLPVMPRDFMDVRLPLTRPRLEHRLQMLAPEHHRQWQLLEELWQFVVSSRPEGEAALIAQSQSYAEAMSTAFGCFWCRLLVDVHLLTVACRRRREGLAAPQWQHPLSQLLQWYWRQPDWQLGPAYSWVVPLQDAVNSHQVLQVEQQQLRVLWQALKPWAHNHWFDLVAVLIYSLRWLIIQAWVRQDITQGQDNMAALVEEALQAYGDIWRNSPDYWG